VLDAGGFGGSVCVTFESSESSSANVNASGRTTKSPFGVACGIDFTAGGFRQGNSRGPSAARAEGVKPATTARAAPNPRATRHRPEHNFMAASLMQSSERRLAGASARLVYRANENPKCNLRRWFQRGDAGSAAVQSLQEALFSQPEQHP
jgi:hypothetical protein